MPRNFCYSVAVLASFLAVIGVVFALTGGIDQIFFRPNDFQKLSLPLTAGAIALLIVTLKPKWTALSDVKFSCLLVLVLAALLSWITLQVLNDAIGRMLFEYSRFTDASTVAPAPSLESVPRVVLPEGYSILNSYRTAAARASLPDWWTWGAIVTWVMSALIISSVLLKTISEAGITEPSPPMTKEEEIKALENRIWARGFFLKARAVLALVLIFAVLAAGGNFIYNAGRLIEVETREETRLDRLSSFRSNLQSEVEIATQRLGGLQQRKLDLELLLGAARSVAIPEIPVAAAPNGVTPEVDRSTLGQWTAFAVEVCRTLQLNEQSTSSSLGLCFDSNLSELLARRAVIVSQRAELNASLRSYSQDLSLELTGADGRFPGDGPRAQEAREGIEQVRALLADLNLEVLALEQELQSAASEDQGKTAAAVNQAFRDQDFAVFHLTVNTWLQVVSSFESEIAFLTATIERLSSDVTAKSESIGRIDETISTDIERVFPEEVKSGPDWPTLMATALTRISILLILVFLVQILVGLYRYSLRLAAFYDARADALSLGHVDNDGFAKWSETLSPKDIDFGRNPVSPSQHLENMVTKILNRQKKEEAKSDD